MSIAVEFGETDKSVRILYALFSYCIFLHLRGTQNVFLAFDCGRSKVVSFSEGDSKLIFRQDVDPKYLLLLQMVSDI